MNGLQMLQRESDSFNSESHHTFAFRHGFYFDLAPDWLLCSLKAKERCFNASFLIFLISEGYTGPSFREGRR